MQITEAADSCRFPKLEECAHFHYERVNLPAITVSFQNGPMDRSLHSHHSAEEEEEDWHLLQVTSGSECWQLQRNLENFRLLDSQLHQCIYDRKISQLPDLSKMQVKDLEESLPKYIERFSKLANNSINCAPVLNWLQMDNKGHRLLVPSEESRSINTPAVAAAYSIRKYVSQARDELNLEVGDMISVIDMASPGESMWWRGKRGFQVGFFPQNCVNIIGDKVPRNLPAPVIGSLAISPIKPVLRKHGKLIAFFRSFILNRPSRRRLKQSGILRERVFGCDLGEHLLNSGNEVPMVLKCCAEFIETHGIVDGIYRLSGVTSNIQRLRHAFDEDRIPNLYTEDILHDIHSVASLLKMYFRELPIPLCTYQLYQSFVAAVQGCNASARNATADRERLLKMRETVQKLPPPHYRTLQYLTKHLAAIARHGPQTGMTTRNIAIVWAPNLLRCAELEGGGVAALQGVGVQAVVTEFLIYYADWIFCDSLPLSSSNDTSPKRLRPKSLAISFPTRLITLEEARSKQYKGFIDVGGGPQSLPKKYHTVIDLPLRKRPVKRSPIGWKTLFGKSRQRKVLDLDIDLEITNEVINSLDLDVELEEKGTLRSVKSADSLSESDALPPMNPLSKPHGHNRSVSHDSYFDTMQNSLENSLLDLSEIQMNFELEEAEMGIFSEDESFVSSPRVKGRKVYQNSPRKLLLSPDSASRKRTRLEEQLSDIQFIDCCTPETTQAVVHPPKNKSPRNSQLVETPEPQSPIYRLLESASSADPTPEVIYKKLPGSPAYENVVATISITYKSPVKSKADGDYELVRIEEAQIPTSVADLPIQEAKIASVEEVLTATSILEVNEDFEAAEDEDAAEIAADVKKEVAKDLQLVEEVELQELDAEFLRKGEEIDGKVELDELAEEEEEDFPKLDTTLSELLDSYDQLARASGDWSYENVDVTVNSNSPNQKAEAKTEEEPEEIEILNADYENVTFTNSLDLEEPSKFEDQMQASQEVDGTPGIPPAEDVYQQVKYFRRSVHEINALVESEQEEFNITSTKEKEKEDSLEDYTEDSLETVSSTVKALTNKFEGKEKVRPSLPPCIRARNLKNAPSKSLDEEEFRRQTNGQLPSLTCRRQSLDEETFNKISTLPKSLNKPKKVPEESDLLHLVHDTHLNLNRERIEKYKEERRKFLHEKYRSESFKENKDVLLSRLKVFTKSAVPKEEKEVEEETAVAVPQGTFCTRRKKDDVFCGKREVMEKIEKMESSGSSCRRPERISPSYCIKDMKAIFESKSQP